MRAGRLLDLFHAENQPQVFFVILFFSSPFFLSSSLHYREPGALTHRVVRLQHVTRVHGTAV